MPDPIRHAEQRNWLERIAGWIPGFHGYLEKQYRRESDQLARMWLADRLERSKGRLDDYLRQLMDQGQLAELPHGDRLRSRLDGLIGRFRSAPAGYSGLFDYVKVRESMLDQVYQMDMSLMEHVDDLAKMIEMLPEKPEPPSAAIPATLRKLEEVDRLFNQRGDLLNGLGEPS